MPKGIYIRTKKIIVSELTKKKLSDKQKEYCKIYRSNKMTIEEKRQKAREYVARLKKETFNILGNKCVKCNFTDHRALQIDHIAGGGVKELSRRGSGQKYKGHYYSHVKNSILSGENVYQLLCANCNWIKRFENNEHFKVQ